MQGGRGPSTLTKASTAGRARGGRGRCRQRARWPRTPEGTMLASGSCAEEERHPAGNRPQAMTHAGDVGARRGHVRPARSVTRICGRVARQEDTQAPAWPRRCARDERNLAAVLP